MALSRKTAFLQSMTRLLKSVGEKKYYSTAEDMYFRLSNLGGKHGAVFRRFLSGLTAAVGTPSFKRFELRLESLADLYFKHKKEGFPKLVASSPPGTTTKAIERAATQKAIQALAEPAVIQKLLLSPSEVSAGARAVAEGQSKLAALDAESARLASRNEAELMREMKRAERIAAQQFPLPGPQQALPANILRAEGRVPVPDVPLEVLPPELVARMTTRERLEKMGKRGAQRKTEAGLKELGEKMKRRRTPPPPPPAIPPPEIPPPPPGLLARGLKRAGGLARATGSAIKVGIPIDLALLSLKYGGPILEKVFPDPSKEIAEQYRQAQLQTTPFDLLAELERDELIARRQSQFAAENPGSYEVLTRMMTGQNMIAPRLTPTEEYIGGGSTITPEQRAIAEQQIGLALSGM